MAGKLNFAIALNMTTNQFKKGSDLVRRSLKNIQYQVLGMASAFGLGAIGLSNMVRQFIDVARETNRARVALKNISGDAQGFAQNMDFLVKSSNRWGQDLNGMTSEFAKFSAAATSAGISIQEQQNIFESFTRSITAFGMSTTDAHLAYLALSQMMSKGKISSEELRRQLGERMPIAMEAMARAAGVTIQELDGLLRGGKLLAKDMILPFVKEMENMLPNVDVDNLETSVNRLRNTFTKLTEDLKIGDAFKRIVDGANKMLSGLQSSFLRVVTVIATTFIAGKLVSALKSLTLIAKAENAKVLASKVATEEQAILATAKRVAAEKNFANLSTLYNKASDNEKLAYYTKYTAAKRTLDQARLRETSALLAQETAAHAAAAMKTQTAWTVAGSRIANIFKGAILSIKAALSSIIPMAVIGILTNFVFKLIEARKEAERIKRAFSDYRSELSKIAGGAEANLLKTSLAILKDRKSTTEEIKNAHAAINGILGKEITSQRDLNKAVAERVKLLEATARASFQANKIVETEENIKGIYSKYGGESEMNSRYMSASSSKGMINKALGMATPVEKDMNELIALKNILSDAKAGLEAAVKSGVYNPANSTTTTTTTTPTDSSGSKKSLKDVGEKTRREILEMVGEAFDLSGNGELEFWDSLKEMGGVEPGEIKNIGPSMVGKGQRDDTFDYKKSESDKLGEEYDRLSEYISRLREEGKVAMEEIWKEEQNLTSLSDALKLAELKEDIQGLNLDIFNESVDGITGFANALERVANSWSRIAGEDMSGFERMVAIINAMGDTIGAVVDSWQSYLAIKEMIAMKDSATAAQEQILSGQRIANDIAEGTSSVAKSAVVAAALGVEQMAATGVMAAKSAAAYASIPGAGVGLAASQIAAFQALIASAMAMSALPGFKDGGIVGGLSKSGDKQLVRVNAGEMIMNTRQQSRLWGAIQKGDFNGGGEVKFKIEGNSLVGVLDQYGKKKARQ